MSDLLNEVKQMHSQIIEWRRHFHQNAELSFKEYKTSDFIEEQLKSFGNIEILRPTSTGVIGKIHGKGNGPIIALRAPPTIRSRVSCSPRPIRWAIRRRPMT